MLKNILAVAVLAAAGLVSLSGAVSADVGDANVTYVAQTPAWGHLTVNAPIASHFTVMGEQANGTYLPVSSGTVGPSGSTTVSVPHSGPTENDQPQYMVQVTLPNGEALLLLAGGEGKDDRWWLD